LQLVTPFVLRHREETSFGDESFRHQAGVAVMSLHFVPEPAAGLQLLAGLAGLAALHRFSPRRVSSESTRGQAS
jgi:hypothetical protein